MEKLHLRSSSSQAKSLGITVSIVGVFIVTFYKGPSVLIAPSCSSSPHKLLLQRSNWVIGGFLLAADCVFASAWLIVPVESSSLYVCGKLKQVSLWFLTWRERKLFVFLIFQASVLKRFPAELIVVFYYCFFVTLQLGIVCLVMERDLSAWSFKPDVKLVAVVYSVSG